jgi:hypothetical protein
MGAALWHPEQEHHSVGLHPGRWWDSAGCLGRQDWRLGARVLMPCHSAWWGVRGGGAGLAVGVLSLPQQGRMHRQDWKLSDLVAVALT